MKQGITLIMPLAVIFMKTRYQIIIITFFALYLLTVLLTDISLVGFWTDIIFSILLAFFALRITFKNKTTKLWLTIVLRGAAVIFSTVIFGLIALNLANPFVSDIFKMRSFYYQRIEGRIFHAYFKPVGAYSGGQGNFWITESPVFFPVIERKVYYDRTVHHDFNDDTWEGEPIDNYEVVKSYIKDEVIDRQK